MRRLGGPHAITKQPIRDLADLQRRLPELEAGMREAIARDTTLGPEVADALVAAIRSGSGVTDGKLGARDNFLWMSYKPKGVLGVISPPCVQLQRDYDAFDIVVEVAPPAATPTQDARCALSVTRNCERQNPTITLDASGSSANPRVERAGAAVPGPGPRWTVADSLPYSEDATFVVRAQGSAAQGQTGKVHHFRIPKICGNLAYLGASPGRTVAAAAKAASCEKSVSAPMCKPWAEVSVEPPTVEVHHPATIKTAGGYHDGLAKLEIACQGETPEVIDNPPHDHPYTPGAICCHDGYNIRYETRNAAGDVAEATTTLQVTPHDWIFRPSLAYIMPTDGEQSRDIVLSPGGAAHEEYEIDSGLGVSLALERRFNERIGLEFGAIFGQVETSYELTVGGQSGEYDLSPKLYAFTVGPNFHLLGCGAVDLYLGPFVGYGGLYDPNYWVFGHRFHADFSGDFLWGAQLGLDVPFSRSSDWRFHGGVRYLVFDQETDAGTIDVDPLVFELGLAYHF